MAARDEEIRLAARAASGDRVALNELLASQRRPMLYVAERMLGDEAGAEDAVQDALLDAYRGLPTFDTRRSFRNWLWTIVANRCRGAMKQAAKRPDRLASSAEAFGAESCVLHESPERRLAAEERATLLKNALLQLPPVQAEAIRMRFYRGMLFREIAAEAGCSLLTAKNRVKWGLLRLAAELNALREDERDAL